MSEHWYVYRDGGAVIGPITTEQIVRGVAAGKVPTDSLVRAEDGDEWIPLLDVEEFAEAAEATVAFGPLPGLHDDIPAAKPSERPPPPPDRASIKLAVAKASAAKQPAASTNTTTSPSWMVRVGGEVRGPVTSEQLHRAIGAGLLDEDVHVLSLAGGAWAPFSLVAVQGRAVVAPAPPAASPVVAPAPPAASPVVAPAPSAASAAPDILFTTPATNDFGSSPAMRETNPSLLALVIAKVRAADDPMRRRRHQQIGVGIAGTLVVFAIVAVMARGRTSGGDASSKHAAVPVPTTAVVLPQPSAVTDPAAVERQRLLASEKPSDWKVLIYQHPDTAEAKLAREKLESNTLCGNQQNWKITKRLLDLDNVRALVVDTLDGPATAVGKRALFDALSDLRTKEADRLQEQRDEIAKHVGLPAEEPARKALLSAYDRLIKANRTWAKAVEDYDGTNSYVLINAKNVATAAIKSASADDTRWWELCRDTGPKTSAASASATNNETVGKPTTAAAAAAPTVMKRVFSCAPGSVAIATKLGCWCSDKSGNSVQEFSQPPGCRNWPREQGSNCVFECTPPVAAKCPPGVPICN